MSTPWATKQEFKLFEGLGRLTTQITRLAINASLKKHDTMLKTLGVDLQLRPINTLKNSAKNSGPSKPLPYNLVETVYPEENKF